MIYLFVFASHLVMEDLVLAFCKNTHGVYAIWMVIADNMICLRFRCVHLVLISNWSISVFCRLPCVWTLMQTCYICGFISSLWFCILSIQLLQISIMMLLLHVFPLFDFLISLNAHCMLANAFYIDLSFLQILLIYVSTYFRSTSSINVTNSWTLFN